MIEKIYFDMDGVLCDFWGMLLDHDPSITEWDETLWGLILTIPNFWENLDFIEGSLELWDYCYHNFDVEILTAPSIFDKRSVSGKGEWLKTNLKNYDFKINMTSSYNKCLFASKNALLIDDMEMNVEQFKEHGGEAILFKNPYQVMMDLEKILFEESIDG
jgi:5'(3')-deoxyribonucleotidase